MYRHRLPMLVVLILLLASFASSQPRTDAPPYFVISVKDALGSATQYASVRVTRTSDNFEWMQNTGRTGTVVVQVGRIVRGERFKFDLEGDAGPGSSQYVATGAENGPIAISLTSAKTSTRMPVQVVDQANLPVVGAAVSIRTEQKGATIEFSDPGISSVNGLTSVSFIMRPAPYEHVVIASKAGYRQPGRVVITPSMRPSTKPMVIRLEKMSEVTLVIETIDAQDSEPIPQASVEGTYEEGSRPYFGILTQTRSSDNKVTLPADRPHGTVVVKAKAKDYEDASQKLSTDSLKGEHVVKLFMKPSKCKITGAWTQTTPGIGTSTWTVPKVGRSTESGLGTAKGFATLENRKLTIVWETDDGGYAGTYEWNLDQECKSGTGHLQFSKGRGGAKFTSTVSR